MTDHPHLTVTPLLDFNIPAIESLVSARGWRELSAYDRIGAAYDFVRNEIAFGYNRTDTLTASQVLRDGYGQCNTKATLLMALLRSLAIPCRLHGFTIHKSLQRGIVPEAVYWLSPTDILHSWVEVYYHGDWLQLEGCILDDAVLHALQREFPDQTTLCAYGAGTTCLQHPAVEWTGTDTYIQQTGINADLGVFDQPDYFYAKHQQLTGLRGWFYKIVVRHWMNRRVAAIRVGQVPTIPSKR